MGARSRNSNVPTVEDSESALGSPLLDVVLEPRTPRPRGVRTITATLPNGRTAWLHLDPAPVSVAEINRLVSALERADARHALALQSESDALARLSRATARDVQRLTEARVRGDLELRAQMAVGDARIAQKVRRGIRRDRAVVRKDWRHIQAVAQRIRRRSIWDHVVVASAVPLFAAYGQRGNPLGINNITLALSLGVWLVGDEIGDALSGRPSERTGVVRELDLWSHLAPIGNVLTGWWLLRDSQQERFATGIADAFRPGRRDLFALAATSGSSTHIRSTYVAQIDLAAHVAADHIDDLRTFTKVPALATLVSATLRDELKSGAFRIRGISASVDAGILTITVVVYFGPSRFGVTSRDSIFSDLTVAWAVDTRAPKR